jgi:hypothetical protein
MKATAVITIDSYTDVDGKIFEKLIKLAHIEVSEEFFDDFNDLTRDKQFKVHFERET